MGAHSGALFGLSWTRFAPSKVQADENKGGNRPKTFGRIFQRSLVPLAPSPDFRKSTNFIGSYWERVVTSSRHIEPDFIGYEDVF
jgi:hypothetical protein